MRAFELPNGNENKWNRVSEVTLEELHVRDMEINENGLTEFEIAPKKILTLKYN